MFIEYILHQSEADAKEALLVVAQERYPGDKLALFKLLLELDVLSRVCPKLDTQAYFELEDKIVLIPNLLSDEASNMLQRIHYTASLMNNVLKGMVQAFSVSIARFTDRYTSPVTDRSIKHMADVQLTDIYLRNCFLEEIGVVEYAFYNKKLLPFYPDFIKAVKLSVDLHQKHNRGNEAYNHYEEEAFKPLYNDAKIGVDRVQLEKNEELLASSICEYVLELLGGVGEDFSDEERFHYNTAHTTLQQSPYSACLLLVEIFDIVASFDSVATQSMIGEIMEMIYENRTLLSVLNAYSKQLTWYSKEINGSTYALLHYLLKEQSAWVQDSGASPLPEDIYLILDNDSLLDDSHLLRKNIILVSTYRDDDAVLMSVFKQFFSAVEFYARTEEWAKENNNPSPIADISDKRNLPLFHNPNLDSLISFIEYRKNLAA